MQTNEIVAQDPHLAMTWKMNWEISKCFLDNFFLTSIPGMIERAGQNAACSTSAWKFYKEVGNWMVCLSFFLSLQ
jgi:hypothetical protein